MFEIKPYSPENYPEIVSWWEQWEWDSIPQEFLPADGLIVSANEKNICAAFIYLTNTPICWVENYISCKDADKFERQKSLDILIDAAIDVSKTMGFRVIMSSIRHPVLGRKLENKGFVVSDTGMSTYMRAI